MMLGHKNMVLWLIKSSRLDQGIKDLNDLNKVVEGYKCSYTASKGCEYGHIKGRKYSHCGIIKQDSDSRGLCESTDSSSS